MPNIHDTGYKKLFSDKRIFRQLIETFVTEKWVKDIDFDSCEQLDKTFIADHYKETQSDIIYRVKLQGRELYIIILLEFQSTVDRFMSLRFLNYISNFLMDYLQTQKNPKNLPAVFPLLLYNGDKKWTAPVAIETLIEGNELLGKYGIRFQYFKLAENEFDKEKLLKISNLISTLFLAEAHYDIEELEEQFLLLFEKEEDKKSISLLLNWFLNLHEHGRITSAAYDKLERVYKDKEEVKEMLITAIKKEKKAIFEDGLQQGLQKGLQKGLQEGLEKGLQKGLQKGIETGKQKGQREKSIDVARRMLAFGQDIELIHKVTGLPVAEIEALRNKLR